MHPPITFDDCTCYSFNEACSCEKDCPYQDYLVKNGFAMSCDACNHVGHVDSSGWIGILDEEGRCFVFCSEKCAGEENVKIFNAAQEEADKFIEWMDKSLPNHGFFLTEDPQ